MEWMDGWMIGGVCKTGWLCPLPNTDAGNLEYCSLLRRPVALEVLCLLSWKREKSDQIRSCAFCLRRPTKNMWRQRQHLICGMTKWLQPLWTAGPFSRGPAPYFVIRRCRHK